MIANSPGFVGVVRGDRGDFLGMSVSCQTGDIPDDRRQLRRLYRLLLEDGPNVSIRSSWMFASRPAFRRRNRNLELLRLTQFFAEVLYCDKQSDSGRACYGGGPNLFPR